MTRSMNNDGFAPILDLQWRHVLAVLAARVDSVALVEISTDQRSLSRLTQRIFSNGLLPDQYRLCASSVTRQLVTERVEGMQTSLSEQRSLTREPVLVPIRQQVMRQ